MIKEVEVPDIEGLSLDEASGILRDKQLSLDIMGIDIVRILKRVI